MISNDEIVSVEFTGEELKFNAMAVATYLRYLLESDAHVNPDMFALAADLQRKLVVATGAELDVNRRMKELNNEPS